MKGHEKIPVGGREEDHSRRFAFAMRALSRTPVSLAYQNRDMEYEWIENPHVGFDVGDVLGRTDADFLPRLAADRLEAAKRHVLETREQNRFELPVNLGGEVFWFDVWIDPDMAPDGSVIGVFSTIIDISDRKKREVQLKNLLREVSHRSKNLLAIILSLASQTARSSTSLQGFVAAFSGRLQAIARAQDLVTDRDWQGALLSDLISRQIALFRGGKSLPVTIDGADVVISPSAALYVGLALHELAGNAVRHGQLVSRDGQIDVRFGIDTDQSGDRVLVLSWSETVVDRAEDHDFEPLARKFLETVVPLAVEGSGKIENDGSTLTYTLTIDGGLLS